MRDAECVELLRWALPHIGLRWEGFRRVRGQVCKRISRRLAALGLDDQAAYRDFLAAHPGEWTELDGLCRITISSFFRDRAVWAWLREEGLPGAARLALRRGDPVVRCWSAGCASGEEPYGIAITFRLAIAPAFPGLGLSIVATDVEEAVLERARRACYAPGTLRDLPPEWAAAAFETRGPERCLRAEFREPVELRREDLRSALPDGLFHIVLCRNLAFTYFDVASQARVLAALSDRLVPGGFLVIGAHETLPAETCGYERVRALPVFRRTEAGRRPQAQRGVLR